MNAPTTGTTPHAAHRRASTSLLGSSPRKAKQHRRRSSFYHPTLAQLRSPGVAGAKVATRMSILRLVMLKNSSMSRGKDLPLRTAILQRALWRNLVVPLAPRCWPTAPATATGMDQSAPMTGVTPNGLVTA